MIASRILGVASLTLACVATAGAGEMVEFPGAGGKPVKAYLARPEGGKPGPAIIVIQEWWGLTDWIKKNADHFAERGYVALAVDLYDGKVTADAGEAHELMRALDQAEGVAKLKAAVDYLAKQEFVEHPDYVGAIGWCMGGGYARQLAQASPQVKLAAICYGSVATDPDQLKALKGKRVLGIFGEDDRGIPVDKVMEFGEGVKKQGDDTEVDIHIYPKAGHGFMRPGGQQFNQDAADSAWKFIDRFFEGLISSDKF